MLALHVPDVSLSFPGTSRLRLVELFVRAKCTAQTKEPARGSPRSDPHGRTPLPPAPRLSAPPRPLRRNPFVPAALRDSASLLEKGKAVAAAQNSASPTSPTSSFAGIKGANP